MTPAAELLTGSMLLLFVLLGALALVATGPEDLGSVAPGTRRRINNEGWRR